LSHSAFIGISRRHLGRAVAELAGPWQARRESDLRGRRGRDRQRAEGAGRRHDLVLTDRVLVTGFLDASVLAAVTTTAGTLTLAVLPAYLLLARTGAPAGQARAAAVLAWLAAHALIAWTLRTQPALPWRANPAFPAWALAALAAGITATLTPASQLIGLQGLPLRWLPAIAALVLLATLTARAAARIPLFARRL
jgi:hypothetical protein